MLISTEKLKNFFSSILVRSWLHLTMTSLFLIISPINHVVETCEIVDCLDSSIFTLFNLASDIVFDLMSGEGFQCRTTFIYRPQIGEMN